MKSIKRVLITWIMVSIVALTSVGCMNKEVVVATINGQNVSESLYRIFLWAAQRGLESLQPAFWELDNLEGKTPEEYAKDKALKSVSYYIVVEQKAKELNIKLTDEEKEKVKEAAKQAMNENKNITEKYRIKQKDYEAYYSYGTKNEKVKQILGESYEPNDEEIYAAIEVMKQNNEVANEATIVHILFNTKDEMGADLPADKKQAVYEKAQSVLKKALAGEDMSTLAESYSDDRKDSSDTQFGEYTFTSGSMEQSIEDIVFDKNNVGKVYPELIETSMGYEIIKVIEVDLESEEALKQKATEKIKSDFADEELNQMVSIAEVKKTEVYDTIHKMEEDSVNE